MKEHGEDLRDELIAAGEDPSLSERVKAWTEDNLLDSRRAAITAYAMKATRTPSEMTQEDVRTLHAEGLVDEDVVTLAHVISFFNGANRVADCLHVDPEPGAEPEAPA